MASARKPREQRLEDLQILSIPGDKHATSRFDITISLRGVRNTGNCRYELWKDIVKRCKIGRSICANCRVPMVIIIVDSPDGDFVVWLMVIGAHSTFYRQGIASARLREVYQAKIFTASLTAIPICRFTLVMLTDGPVNRNGHAVVIRTTIFRCLSTVKSYQVQADV